MDVRGPKPLGTPEQSTVVEWARRQLEIARDIVDNPGGGLLFATQATGQVRAALAEQDDQRWSQVGQLLLDAEDAGVRRRYERFRELVGEALAKLS